MILYYEKGDMDLSLKYAKKASDLFKEINNFSRFYPLLNMIGDIYRVRGDFKQALEYMEQSLAVSEEFGEKNLNPMIICNLIELHIEMGNLKIAQQYFKRLEKLSNQVDNEWFNLVYRLSKALLVKQSSRITNLAEAEVI
jgi:tetratricopeptide (TPR) repeat protein